LTGGFQEFHDASGAEFARVLRKSLELKGLAPEEASILLSAKKNERKAVVSAAGFVKDRIYGRRVVLFAPVYSTNICVNSCLYCAFSSSNLSLKRRRLERAELQREIACLLSEGHKRILLVFAQDPFFTGSRIAETIKEIYSFGKSGRGIRRVNVNCAPLSVEDFREITKAGIGTYQIFQETYDRDVYRAMHGSGSPKSDFDYRYEAPLRAFQGGIDDVGIGVLLGLTDFRKDIPELIKHAGWMEERCGFGPHTVSIPRVRTADGSAVSRKPPFPVSDDELELIIAVLRLSLPYTGIILSTRENHSLRMRLLRAGVSQISAGSRTSVGGYGAASGVKSEDSMPDDNRNNQFGIYDYQTLKENVADLVKNGFIPSFCTACYRSRRTGGRFMEITKKGKISRFCTMNALLTFQEYARDFRFDCDVEREFHDETSRFSGEFHDRMEAIKQGENDLFY